MTDHPMIEVDSTFDESGDLKVFVGMPAERVEAVETPAGHVGVLTLSAREARALSAKLRETLDASIRG